MSKSVLKGATVSLAPGFENGKEEEIRRLLKTYPFTRQLNLYSGKLKCEFEFEFGLEFGLGLGLEVGLLLGPYDLDLRDVS